jgi:predicted N-acyltransferase
VTFDVQIAHSVEEIGQEAWDRLAGERPFASYRWYRFGETVLADNVPIYIVLSLRGEPVARGTFWLRSREQLPIFSSKILRCLVETILRRWPLLICQSPLVESSGLILPEEPLLRDATLETIALAMQDQARKYQASFTGYDYLKQEEASYTGWPDGFTSVQIPEPGTRLVVKWPDFETYMKSRSRSVRRDYHRHGMRAAERAIEVKCCHLEAPLDEPTLDKAVALIRNVTSRHESSPYPWARAMLKNAYMVNAVWLTAEIGDRLVGCDLLLEDRGTWAMMLLGLDYDVEYVYFQLMYAPIRHAVEEGAQSIWGGSGSYELKQRLGFEIEAKNYAVFTGRGPLFNGLARWVAGMEGEG